MYIHFDSEFELAIPLCELIDELEGVSLDWPTSVSVSLSLEMPSVVSEGEIKFTLMN